MGSITGLIIFSQIPVGVSILIYILLCAIEEIHSLVYVFCGASDFNTQAVLSMFWGLVIFVVLVARSFLEYHYILCFEVNG